MLTATHEEKALDSPKLHTVQLGFGCNGMPLCIAPGFGICCCSMVSSR